MVEVDVAAVKLDAEMKTPIVILREKSGKPKRLLPIWVGIFEALAILTEIENHPVLRPMTHDLLKSVIEHVGAKVVSILVSELKEATFYAEITLRLSNGEVIKVDSRPSDAMALALRAKAPIYVAEEIMAGSSISQDSIRMDDKEHLKDVLKNLDEEDIQKI
jgi:bifunctional DNase/RNase